MKKLLFSAIIVGLLLSTSLVLAEPPPFSLPEACSPEDAIDVCQTNSASSGCPVKVCWKAVLSVVTGIDPLLMPAVPAGPLRTGVLVTTAVTLGWLLLRYTILPFIAIWMILYAFMKELRIFRRARNVNLWLPLLIALISLPSRLAFLIAFWVFSISTWVALIVFGLIFIVGMWRYGVLRRAQWTSIASTAEAEAEVRKGIKEHLKQLIQERADLVAEIPNSSGDRLTKLTERIEAIDTEIANVRGQKDTIDDL